MTKLSPDCSSMVYSTYLGGWTWEIVESIAVDQVGNAYIGSGSQSTDFPTTPGAYDRVCDNCYTNLSGDATVTKLRADGSEFLYSTFVGGADADGQDAYYDIHIDLAGNAYLAGYSSSDDYPTTPGALQPSLGGEYDVVVTKLNADGSDLLYSTYLGGTGTDIAFANAVDAAGQVYVAGQTNSVDFPIASPWQPANGGGRDAFLVRLDEDASTLLFGTYFGGSGDESEVPLWAYMGLAYNHHGLFLTGATSSTDLPTTPGAYDESFNGGAYDAFVAHLDDNSATYRVYLPMVSKHTDELLVWYDFEGAFLASGIVADRSGSGQDAQINGTVDVAEGVSGGQSILFSRTGYIQAQSNPAVGRTTVSFSLWFKTDNPGENYKLASAAWWDWGPGSGWIMATHIPEFWSDDGQSLYLPGQPNNENSFLSGEWNHEVLTYDGDRIKEYTNGQLINDWATTGAAIGQGQAMAVGSWPQFWGYDFSGSLDEFKVFTQCLTQEEVLALYNQGR